MSLLAEVQFGREVCGELEAAESREWLVTNGLGGYASGTIAGTTTRRYHGLLIAALQPPVRRTMLVNGFDETVRYLGNRFSLSREPLAKWFYLAERLSADREFSSGRMQARVAIRLRGCVIGETHLDEAG